MRSRGPGDVFAEVGRHPDDRPGIGAGRIGDQLAQMADIGGAELVLDDQHIVVGVGAAEEVEMDAEYLRERVGNLR